MSLSYNAPLIFAPLAVYFYTLGLLNSGHRAKILDGRTDFLLLAASLSGLIVFGPLGLSWIQPRIGQIDPLQILRLLALYGIVTLFLSIRYGRRLVIYNADPGQVRSILESQAEGTGFRPTLQGLEDPKSGQRIAIDPSPRTHSTTIDFEGPWQEIPFQEWREATRGALEESARGQPRSRLTYVLFGASCLMMVFPLAALLITQPRARAAFWMLIQQIRGG